MQTKTIEKYFFFGLLLSTFLFTFFIFRPFLPIIIISASFAVVLHPIYEWFNKIKIPSFISAGLTVMFFVLAICGPLFGIGLIVFHQSQDLYISAVGGGHVDSFIENTGIQINNFLPKGITFDTSEKVSELISFMTSNIANIFTTTLSTLLSFILVLLSLYYFLKDGDRWRKALMVLSPLSDSDDNKILARLSQSINGIMKGYMLIALIQGTLMSIGLGIFGVPHPALWGVTAAIGSLIPSVGTAIVSIPAIVFLFATGHTVQGFSFLAWAFFLVGTVDNFLTPLVIGKKINIPQILVLFSVLGGLVMMGPVGFLIGPLAVSLLYALISIYRNEFNKNTLT